MHAFPSDGGAGDGLLRADAAHAGAGRLNSRHDGASTRHIDLCLSRLRPGEWVRRDGGRASDAMRSLVATGTHSQARRDPYGGPSTYRGHWEGRMPQIDAEAIWGDMAM